MRLILKLGIFLSFAIFLIGEAPKSFAFPLGSKCSNIKNIKDIYKDNILGIVTIKAGNSIGTGFVINHTNNKTYFLTNFHVVKGQNDIDIIWSDGSKSKAYIISIPTLDLLLYKYKDSQNNYKDDLAILEMEGIKGKVTNLSTKPISIGDEVFAIGTPKGLDLSLSKGIISAIRQNGEIIQTDVALNSGNSGGPLIDKYGCVIGINTFDIENTEGLNFAISLNVFEAFINSRSDKFGKAGNRDFYSSLSSAVLALDRKNRRNDPESSYYSGPKGSIKPKGKGWFFIKESCKYWDEDKMGECVEKLMPIEKEWTWLRFIQIKGNPSSNPENIIFTIKTTDTVRTLKNNELYSDGFDPVFYINCKYNLITVRVPEMGMNMIDNESIRSYHLDSFVFNALAKRGCDVKPIDY